MVTMVIYLQCEGQSCRNNILGLKVYLDFQSQKEKIKMQATVTNNPSYLHPEVNKILENFTKYVSKPLGLNKPMSEEKARHGNIL